MKFTSSLFNESMLMHPNRIVFPSSWVGHIPFAAWLVEVLRPRCIVELGTHSGNSYLSFCQAVQGIGLDTLCYAVDTWEGDEHAGRYGEEVYLELARYHDSHYAGFSRLIRSTFDNSLPYFAANSIDLLHIDGLHTYDAVKHDFESWLPKVSNRGVVLLHDINVRERGFGVWQLWEELTHTYPHIEFPHSHGLGVLFIGKDLEAPFRYLTSHGNKAETLWLKRLFAELGDRIYQRYSLSERDAELDLMRERLVTLTQVHERTAVWAQQLDAQIVVRDRQLTERNGQIASLNQAVAKRERELRDALTTIENLRPSTSWRITYPLRAAKRLLGLAPTIPRSSQSSLWRCLRYVYHRMPLSVHSKRKLQNAFYSRFPSIFAHLPSFQLWKERQQPLERISQIFIKQKPGTISTATEAVDFSLPTTENPLVSVIVPVYGKIDYTLGCLRSIVNSPPTVPFEVVVVDDHSPDDTLDVLAEVGGIRVVSNGTNQGFVRSCNAGARQARGKYLLFLNNDTQVLNGWLDEMIGTFGRYRDAGLVGAKLLYPDGKLQEAGGIIWNDASGWNYGRADDPAKPEYNYLREVDYCSGAAIMIPTELFLSIGGFNEVYAPAYFEDVELAFRVRERGKKVLYQPLAQVVHFEGVSSGTDITKGVKAYQVENRAKFLARWKQLLETDHFEPGTNVPQAIDKGRIARLLILDETTPTPDMDAGSGVIFKMMELLRSLGCHVTFTPVGNLLHLEKYTSALQRIGVYCLYAPSVTSLEQHLRETTLAYDAALFCRTGTANKWYSQVKRHNPQIKTIFYAIDLHFLRESREAEVLGSRDLAKKAQTTRDIEIDLVKKCDVTLIHSSVEREILLSEVPNATILLLPLILEPCPTTTPFAQRRDVAFLGGFQHLPNVDAAMFLAEKILPHIKARIPDIVLYLIGSNPPDEVKKLASTDIVVSGYVPDLLPLLGKIRLTVAPLRYGAGIKGKLVTSLAHGVPCVASSIAVEGMGLTDGHDILIADTEDEVADTIARLYDDDKLWNTLSSNGLAFVQKTHAADIARPVLRRVMEQLSDHK